MNAGTELNNLNTMRQKSGIFVFKKNVKSTKGFLYFIVHDKLILFKYTIQIYSPLSFACNARLEIKLMIYKKLGTLAYTNLHKSIHIEHT